MLAAIAVGAGSGAVIDLRTRRVPNPLTATLAAAGIASAACGISGLSVAASFGGFVLGLALMLNAEIRARLLAIYDA